MFQLYVNNISSLYMEILRSFDILLLQPRAFNYSRPFVRNQVLFLSSFCVNFIFGSENTSFFICPSVITVGLLITEHCFSEHFFLYWHQKLFSWTMRKPQPAIFINYVFGSSNTHWLQQQKFNNPYLVHDRRIDITIKVFFVLEPLSFVLDNYIINNKKNGSIIEKLSFLNLS